MEYRTSWKYVWTTDAKTGRPRILAVLPHKVVVLTWREHLREWGDVLLFGTVVVVFALALLAQLQ